MVALRSTARRRQALLPLSHRKSRTLMRPCCRSPSTPQLSDSTPQPRKVSLVYLSRLPIRRPPTKPSFYGAAPLRLAHLSLNLLLLLVSKLWRQPVSTISISVKSAVHQRYAVLNLNPFSPPAKVSQVISYKKASVVDDVVAAVKSVGGTFAGVYDAISLQDQSYKYTLSILEKLGGGNLTTVNPNPENVASNVKCGNVLCLSPLTHPLWKDYITKALESGQLKCLPEPTIIGKGLESCQAGLDENKKGVSAKKVVIEL